MNEGHKVYRVQTVLDHLLSDENNDRSFPGNRSIGNTQLYVALPHQLPFGNKNLNRSGGSHRPA